VKRSWPPEQCPSSLREGLPQTAAGGRRAKRTALLPSSHFGKGQEGDRLKKMRVPLLLFASLLHAFADGSEGRLAAQIATPNLAGTSWQLLKFQGGDGKTLSSVDQTK